MGHVQQQSVSCLGALTLHGLGATCAALLVGPETGKGIPEGAGHCPHSVGIPVPYDIDCILIYGM